MEERQIRGQRPETDLVLAQGQYALVQDMTKGAVVCYVGPTKQSLSGTDSPVIYNPKTRRFDAVELSRAVMESPFAQEGSYVVLENPTAPGAQEDHPKPGSNSTPKLQYGRKINIPGPVTFPLWPDQNAQVIPGHDLRSNQYLLVRIYNEDEAKKNWSRGVMKRQTATPSTPARDPKAATSAEGGHQPGAPSGAADEVGDQANPGQTQTPAGGGETASHVSSSDATITDSAPEMTTGKLFIIRGTDVSFYIPPTGVEVVPDDDQNYVREAVTLERLEYCILLDEDGNKRYENGPAVVFPEATETFVGRDNSVKFRAIELNEISGIYVQVIADYNEGNREYKVGEELFITGNETRIYYPRPEHAIVKYGDQEKHFAVAIPAGEARFVLDRMKGTISLKLGPCTFLPDPRREVIVRRILDPKVVDLWYPGNKEALEYNLQLAELTRSGVAGDYVTDRDVRRSLGTTEALAANTADMVRRGLAQERFAGDEISRKASFSPPRTITLDTKYDGVPEIQVHTGYAVQVVSKSGARKVVVGPQTVLMEYDQTLGVLTLSKGTPKSDDSTMRTVYLRVKNNIISDLVNAQTGDLVNVAIRVSYRVNFEGNSERWFDVENYIKLMTEHLRSMIRNAVKQTGIEQFYANPVTLVRDTVLGKSSAESSERVGRKFDENGMRVYDVEVLDVQIQDAEIAKALVTAQREVVQSTLLIANERRALDLTREREQITRQKAEETATTVTLRTALENRAVGEQLKLTLARIQAETETNEARQEAELASQEGLDKIHQADLARKKLTAEQEATLRQQLQELELALIAGRTHAVVEQLKAVQPEMIATLKLVSNQALASDLARHLPAATGALGILTGAGSVKALLSLVEGTPLEAGLKGLTGGGTNGGSTTIASNPDSLS